MTGPARILDGKQTAREIREEVARDCARLKSERGIVPGLSVVLVGDEPYYGKAGFKRIPKGLATMPGPVDPARLLVAEMVDGAFEGVSGPISPDYRAAT